MLTRLALQSGAYLASLASVPEPLRWSGEKIEESMRQTLAARAEHDDFWLFGYGSLIWNPSMEHAEQRAAKLDGWHRSFCQRLVGGRAAVDSPGRMLGLVEGGHTDGMAYRLPAATLSEELRLVWIREMAMGAYRPIWAPIEFADGSRTACVVFVADDSHPLHEHDACVETVAPLIARASGPWGSNADYVFRLAAALLQAGMRDAYVAAVAARVWQRVRQLAQLGTAAGAAPASLA